MIISLIGPGNLEFHYKELLGISSEKLESEIENIAKTLAKSKVEIELLPDKGISLEIAKIYKQNKGKKVIGTVPKSDKEIGIKHLQEFIDLKIDGKKLFDETIDSGDWFKHDLTKALFADAVLYLGFSPGTEIERNGAEYLYKFLKFVKLHQKIKAGENYRLIVYSPFLASGKLPKEAEAYLGKDKIKLVYIKNSQELEDTLKNIKS